jgi:ElaB/YqjD/DUF883 family membrane-anchored ribosome-binding protein
MAKPLRENEPTVPENLREIKPSSSADVPTYDTYPDEPAQVIDWKERQERWRAAGRQNPKLNETAEKIGSAVGDMVNRAQEARQRLDLAKEDMRRSSEEKIDELKQRAQEQWSSAAAAAQERLEDWREAARESAGNAKEILVRRTREARIRAKNYVDENPQNVLLGIAGAAFAIGLMARIMRSSRD